MDLVTLLPMLRDVGSFALIAWIVLVWFPKLIAEMKNCGDRLASVEMALKELASRGRAFLPALVLAVGSFLLAGCGMAPLSRGAAAQVVREDGTVSDAVLSAADAMPGDTGPQEILSANLPVFPGVSLKAAVVWNGETWTPFPAPAAREGPSGYQRARMLMRSLRPMPSVPVEEAPQEEAPEGAPRGKPEGPCDGKGCRIPKP